jgi:hypothetical protein
MLHGRPSFASSRPLSPERPPHNLQQNVAIAHLTQGLAAAANLAPQTPKFLRTWTGIQQIEHLLQPSAGYTHVVDGVRVITLQNLRFVSDEAVQLPHGQSLYLLASLFWR